MSGSGAETPRRWFLRRETAAAHQRLDALNGEWPSLETYRRYLLGTYRFRVAVERALPSRAPAALEQWRWARLTGALDADLRQLDVAVPATTKAAMPSQPAAVFGALYVLEGASLGAQILYRRALSLGLSAEHGAQHLWQLSTRKTEWREFLQLLERLEIDDEADLLSGAMWAFGAAEDAYRTAADTP